MFLGDFGRRRPARTGGCCCHLHMQIKPAANIITTAQVNLFIFGEMKLCTISSKKTSYFSTSQLLSIFVSALLARFLFSMCTNATYYVVSECSVPVSIPCHTLAGAANKLRTPRYVLEHSNSRFESIRFNSLCESILIDSFCKKNRPFDSLVVTQLFLLI